MSHKESEKAH